MAHITIKILLGRQRIGPFFAKYARLKIRLKKSFWGTIMTITINRHLMILLLAILLILSQRATALIVSPDCVTSNDTDFFNLTAFEVAPYIPSMDEDGNPYLKGAALANAEVVHYRAQYENAPMVRMPIDRYASLTSKNPEALKNFESRLLIVDPECNELKLFFGNLIGTSELSLQNYLQMYDAAKRLKHKELKEFTEQRVRLKSKYVFEVLDILSKDLAFDVALTKQTLGDELLATMGVGEDNNFKIGGELALLSYAKKGGQVKTGESSLKAFIFLPESSRGIVATDKTVVLLSTGVVYILPDLNAPLAKYALGQLGVPTSVVLVNRLYDADEPMCLMDEVGHWYRIVNGAKERSCNFNQVLIRSLQNGGWKSTFDMQLTPISYQQISDIISKFDILKFVY